jgi:hypothetical protein
VRIGSRKVVKAATPANNLSGAGAHGARIEPARLRKLPSHARRLCFMLGSAYLRHSGPKYLCKVRRLWLLGSGCLGTL